MPKSVHTFRVDFGSAKLSAAQQKRIVGAIERAVAGELPALDLGPTVAIGRMRKEWQGIWIDRFHKGAIAKGLPTELR